MRKAGSANRLQFMSDCREARCRPRVLLMFVSFHGPGVTAQTSSVYFRLSRIQISNESLDLAQRTKHSVSNKIQFRRTSALQNFQFQYILDAGHSKGRLSGPIHTLIISPSLTGFIYIHRSINFTQTACNEIH